MVTSEPSIGDPGEGGGGGGGGGGSGGGTGTVGTVVRTVAITKQMDSSLLRVLISADLASPDDLQLIAYLSIGGIIRKITPINLIFDNFNSNAQGPLTMVTAVAGLAAGSYEAVLSIRNLATQRVPLTIKAGMYMEFVELKNGAL